MEITSGVIIITSVRQIIACWGGILMLVLPPLPARTWGSVGVRCLLIPSLYSLAFLCLLSQIMNDLHSDAGEEASRYRLLMVLRSLCDGKIENCYSTRPACFNPPCCGKVYSNHYKPKMMEAVSHSTSLQGCQLYKSHYYYMLCNEQFSSNRRLLSSPHPLRFI